MRIKMQVANGSAVYTMKGEEDTIEQIIALLKNPDVISITVTKQTPNEYFKSKRKENRYGTDC